MCLRWLFAVSVVWGVYLIALMERRMSGISVGLVRICLLCGIGVTVWLLLLLTSKGWVMGV